MTFEQPATLNKFVAEPVPVNWGSRWKHIRLYLPLFAFMTICMAEQAAFAMWTHDNFKPLMLLLAFLPAAFLLTVALTLNEIRLRSQGGNRLLNIMEKGISFSTVARPATRWPKVVAFWFEDIPDNPELRKMTVEYFGDKKTRYSRRYSLALTKRDQYPALLSELNFLQQQHNLKFRIELDHSVPSIPVPRNPLLSMSMSLAGILVLLHGVPLLLAPFTHDHAGQHHSDPNHEWSPRAQEIFARFVKAHFSSVKEFHHFMVATGAVLTLIGVGLMVAGYFVRRQRPAGASPARQPLGTQTSH
jgi:hypothetical protein